MKINEVTYEGALQSQSRELILLQEKQAWAGTQTKPLNEVLFLQKRGQATRGYFHGGAMREAE